MSQIEFLSGIHSPAKTSIKLSVSNEKSSNSFANNNLNLLFACTSQVFAKSLQVLLLPYFAKWTPVSIIQETTLVVSFPIGKQLFTSGLAFEAKIGIKLEQLVRNSVGEALESLYAKLECENLNEVLTACGLEGLKFASGVMSLTLDYEEIPKQIMTYLEENISKYTMYIDILEAIRPFLTTSQICINLPMGELEMQGIFEF